MGKMCELYTRWFMKLVAAAAATVVLGSFQLTLYLDKMFFLHTHLSREEKINVPSKLQTIKYQMF